MRRLALLLVLGCGSEPIEIRHADGVVVDGCRWPPISPNVAQCRDGPCVAVRCSFVADFGDLGAWVLPRAIGLDLARECAPMCQTPVRLAYFDLDDGAGPRYLGYEFTASE